MSYVISLAYQLNKVVGEGGGELDFNISTEYIGAFTLLKYSKVKLAFNIM